MLRAQMERLVTARLEAELGGDGARWSSVYSDDVVCELVGSSEGPVYGRHDVERWHTWMRERAHPEDLVPVRTYVGEDFCVAEHIWSGRVVGSLVGVEGDGRRIQFRVLHLWEFRDGRIDRETVWLDASTIVAQLARRPQLDADQSRPKRLVTVEGGLP